MHRSLTILLTLIIVLAACAPAAAPATPAPAQPAAPAAQPTQAAPAAAAPMATQAPTSAPAEVRPPASGGMLNPPTLSATTIGSRPNANPTGWLTYRDKVYGFAFQYPPDWTFTMKTNGPTSVLQRISVARLNQSAGNNAEILTAHA